MHVHQCLEKFHGVGIDEFIVVIYFYLLVRFYDVVEHLGHLLGDERQGPAEDVKEVREKIWVFLEIELLDVYLGFLCKENITTNLITAALLL